MLRQARRSCTAWAMIATFLVGLGAAGTALAQQSVTPPGPPPQRERLLTPEDRAAMGQIYWNRVKDRLGLTDKQVADIRSQLDAQRTAARADVQNLIAARKQLRTLLEQQQLDSTQIQKVATDVKTLQANLFGARLQTQIALRGIFTQEQWQGWLALRKGMGHQWMRRGRAFGPGA
jgi:Spy/CpxP family protein refolding chaperone